jgi:hypothetical protein
VKLRFAAAIAVAVGLLTLLGYFIDVPLLLALRLQFVAWASTLAAAAVWVGVFNLLGVHWKRVVTAQPGFLYSGFLILTLVGVIAAGFVAPLAGWGSGPTNAANTWTFRYLQTAVSSAISGLLVFFLVFAGFRLMRRKPNIISVTFVIVAVVSLLGMASLPAGAPDLGLRQWWLWLSQVPAVAGARGLLLGIALGVVATSLRVLLAADRPYES